MEESVSTAARALAPLVGNVAATFRRLQAERKAGQAPLGIQTDLLTQGLRDTLSRLQGGQVDETWWRSVLNELAHAYVAPIFFRKPAVRNWLDLEDVQDGLIALARAKILCQDDPDELDIRVRLAEDYSDLTGEAARFADRPIDISIASLAAGYIASIPQDQRPFVGILQGGHSEVVKQVGEIGERIDNALSTAPLVKDTLGKVSTQELSLILDLYRVDDKATLDRIIALWNRVERGDLSSAPSHVKNQVFYWAARILVANSATFSDAKRLRHMLPDDYAEWNLSILDALIKASENRGDTAIRLLRDDDDPEARSVLLYLLFRFKGPKEALEWCDGVSPNTDPEHFTETGWRNWAVGLAAHLGRWEAAADGLRTLACSHSQWPLILALIEGTTNAALLLPTERRHTVLEGLPVYPQIAIAFRPDTKARHSRAVECFQFVKEHLPIEAIDSSQKVDEWLNWLELMHPDGAESKKARTNLRARIDSGETSVQIVSLAWAFGIELNPEHLHDRLRTREKLGGLDDDDVVVEWFLNQTTMSHREFVAYVDTRQEALDQVLQKELTTAALFESLLADHQIERARKVIDERGSDLDTDLVDRMRAVLDREQRSDPRKDLEEQYEKSKQIIVLQNLIAHLTEVGDRQALVPLVRELFERESTLQNAREVVSTLSASPADFPAITTFLEAYPLIVNRSDDLRSALAWSLFHVGRVDESLEVNLELLSRRKHSDDLNLDVNIAIVTGDWERLSTIVDREWPNRADHNSEMVLMLARLASQFSLFERALDLARLAVEKAPEDPNVLIAAHGIFVQLGRDQDADPGWLAAAVEHSSEQGPVWTVDLKELVNKWIPQLQERSSDIEHRLLDGELPMALASRVMNIPLARILLADSLVGLQDGRKRPVIPIISGVRSPVEIEKDWTVGLDVTSIMLLGRLGLLDRFMNAVKHIKIAPDLMGCLLAERGTVRFHQPILVADAKRVRYLIDRGLIKVIDRRFSPSHELSEEVGSDVAALLEASRIEEGITICVKPIHKADTLLEELADTSEYDDLIFSPADLCKVARQAGRINKEECKRATDFLRTQGQEAGDDLSVAILRRPIHLDRVALSYLQSAHVLEPLANSGLDLRIHPNVADETKALIAASETGDHLARTVEGVRESLRRGMETGKVTLLPRDPETAGENIKILDSVNSLKGLLWSVAEYDALCADDRFVNGRPVAGPTGSTVPVVCVLDVLRHLRSERLVSTGEYWVAIHKLRDAGFGFIPVEADELLYHLLAAEFEDSRVLESAELRCIRQSINKIDALRLLKGDEALALSKSLLMGSIQAIRSLWVDTSLNVNVAAALSTWIWRHLPITTHLVTNDETSALSEEALEDFVSSGLCFLMMVPIMESTERRVAYRNWLERCVVSPLMPASSKSIDDAVTMVLETIKDLSSERRRIFGALFIECLRDDLQERILEEQPRFSLDCGFKHKPILTVEDQVQVEVSVLVASAEAIFSGEGRQEFLSLDGEELILEFAADDMLRLTWSRPGVSPGSADFPELNLIAESPSLRAPVSERFLELLGSTIPEEIGSPLKSAATRKLTKSELSAVFREKATGVMAIQSRLANKIKDDWKPDVDELVPPKRDYWESFCGPVPSNENPESYFVEELLPYRQELINSNLRSGLDICCLGAIRDDLLPGAWLANFDNEKVLDAIQGMPIGADPNTLLGILDVALYRTEDDRFKNIAERAIRTLLDENLGFPGGYDGYRFFEILVDFEMNRIGLVEGAGECPGLWRRMSVWMQVGLIVRNSFVSGKWPKLDELERWCVDQMTPTGNLRRLADCRNEPLVLGHLPRFGYIRHETLLRLENLMERHEAAGRSFPLSTDVKSTLSELRLDATSTISEACGVARLHVLPDSRPSDEIEEILAKSWNTDSSAQSLSVLAGLSPVYLLGEREIGRVIDFLDELVNGNSDFSEMMSQLNSASIIAGTSGNLAVADATGKAVVSFASRNTDPAEVEPMVHILLQAAAAFRKSTDWGAWLGERLAEVAEVLPSVNDSLLWMFSMMECLDSALPAASWAHIRAKSLALSGLKTTN